MPLDRSLDRRVVARIADVLLPDRESGWFINEESARRNLEGAGVDPALLDDLSGDSILRDGLQIANKDPAIIERYLLNTTHILNGLGDPLSHDYMIGEIRAALQADGYDLLFSGNSATIGPYAESEIANVEQSPRASHDNSVEVDRIIRWFERLKHAERTLTLDRRIPERNRSHAKYPIQDEYDLQDLFLAVLQLEYPLAHKEDPTFAAAGLSGRVDIVVPELALYIELKYHDKDKDWATTRKSLSDKTIFYPDGLRCKILLLAIFDSDFTLPKAIIEKDFVKTLKAQFADITIRAVVCQ